MRDGRLTCYEDILVGCSDELHGLLTEECHVLVNGVLGDVFVGAVEEGNQDIQQH